MSISHGQKFVNHYSGFYLFETCFGLITTLEKLGSSGWADHGAVRDVSGDWSGEMLMTGEATELGGWFPATKRTLSISLSSFAQPPASYGVDNHLFLLGHSLFLMTLDFHSIFFPPLLLVPCLLKILNFGCQGSDLGFLFLFVNHLNLYLRL